MRLFQTPAPLATMNAHRRPCKPMSGEGGVSRRTNWTTSLSQSWRLSFTACLLSSAWSILRALRVFSSYILKMSASRNPQLWGKFLSANTPEIIREVLTDMPLALVLSQSKSKSVFRRDHVRRLASSGSKDACRRLSMGQRPLYKMTHGTIIIRG